jgi:hypothetical protein
MPEADTGDPEPFRLAIIVFAESIVRARGKK